MDLGIQIPQKINLLSHVLLETLSFSHVPKAEMLLLHPGQIPLPWEDQALHPHKAPAHSVCISDIPRAQEQGHGKVTDDVRMRDAQKDTKETANSVHGFGNTLRERKDQPQNQATASTTLLGQIWPDNLKAFTDSSISFPQVKPMYMQICLLDKQTRAVLRALSFFCSHTASGEEPFNITTIMNQSLLSFPPDSHLLTLFSTPFPCCTCWVLKFMSRLCYGELPVLNLLRQRTEGLWVCWASCKQGLKFLLSGINSWSVISIPAQWYQFLVSDTNFCWVI